MVPTIPEWCPTSAPHARASIGSVLVIERRNWAGAVVRFMSQRANFYASAFLPGRVNLLGVSSHCFWPGRPIGLQRSARLLYSRVGSRLGVWRSKFFRDLSVGI